MIASPWLSPDIRPDFFSVFPNSAMSFSISGSGTFRWCRTKRSMNTPSNICWLIRFYRVFSRRKSICCVSSQRGSAGVGAAARSFSRAPRLRAFEAAGDRVRSCAHWRSLAEIVHEAAMTTVGVKAVPDTGDARADLRAHLGELAVKLNSGAWGRMLPVLVDAAFRDEEILELQRRSTAERKAAAMAIAARGVELGQIRDDVDLVLCGEMLVGPIFTRHLVTHLPITEAFLDDPKTERNLYSICQDSYAAALESIATKIRDQIVPACMPSCVRDKDRSTPVLDPNCRLIETNIKGEEKDIPQCTEVNGAWTAGGSSNVCFATLIDKTGKETLSKIDNISDYCNMEGFNLEFVIVRRDGVATPGGTGVEATAPR